jgi:hypothetical protein
LNPRPTFATVVLVIASMARPTHANSCVPIVDRLLEPDVFVFIGTPIGLAMPEAMTCTAEDDEAPLVRFIASDSDFGPGPVLLRYSASAWLDGTEPTDPTWDLPVGDQLIVIAAYDESQTLAFGSCSFDRITFENWQNLEAIEARLDVRWSRICPSRNPVCGPPPP